MMPKVRIVADGKIKEMIVEVGVRLGDVLSEEGLIQLPCGGRGLCGSCIVEVSGEVSGPTGNEVLRGLTGKYRLACQVRVLGDVEVKVLSIGRPKVSSTSIHIPVKGGPPLLRLKNLRQVPTSTYPYPVLPEVLESLREVREAQLLVFEGFGAVSVSSNDEVRVALVDLGTTKIAYSLTNLRGDMLKEGALLNPQTAYGADVMTRLSMALEGAGTYSKLRDAAVTAIKSILSSERADACLIAGNSAMESLFLGLPVSTLASKPYTPVLKGPFLTYVERKPCLASPLIAGHVGGDAFMDLVAALQLNPSTPYAVIDVGTNTEVLLIDEDGELHVSSAPAGPAFEGHLTSGTPASLGGFTEVRLEGFTESGSPKFRVVGTGRGLTGSGVVSLVAELVRHGLVDSSGRFREGFTRFAGVKAFVIREEDPSPTLFTQKDMREFQKALSAVRTAWELTLRRAGIEAPQLKQVFIAGNFGVGLNLEDAFLLKLIPPVGEDKVVVAGNMVLSGLRVSLLSKKAFFKAWKLAERANHLDLAEDEEFADLWIRNLRLPEIRR